MADEASGAFSLPPPTYLPLTTKHSYPPHIPRSHPTPTSPSSLSVSSPPQIQHDVDDQPGIFNKLTRVITSINFRPTIRVRCSFLRPNSFPSPTLSLIAMFISTLPLKTYHFLVLLYLPRVYYSRAQSLLTEIKELADERQRSHDGHSSPSVSAILNAIPPAPVHPLNLGHEWKDFRNFFIDKLNLLLLADGLLVAFVSLIFQFTSTIVDPATRAVAFVSVTCAFVGAVCGVIFIIHFRAAPGVLEDRTSDRFIKAERKYYAWFNLWVLFALPVIWTTWSTIILVVFVLLYLWRIYPSAEQHSDVGVASGLAAPIAVTGVLSVGIVYLVLALRMLHSW